MGMWSCRGFFVRQARQPCLRLQLQLLLSNPAAGFDGLPLAAALPERLDDVAAVVSASNDIGG